MCIRDRSGSLSISASFSILRLALTQGISITGNPIGTLTGTFGVLITGVCIKYVFTGSTPIAGISILGINLEKMNIK